MHHKSYLPESRRCLSGWKICFSELDSDGLGGAAMKKQTKTTDTPGRRAAAYWFEDGLPEILGGLVLLACLLILLAAHLRWINSVLFIILWNIGILFWLALYKWGWKILDFIKTRLTYPRAGYASPPGDPDPDMDLLYDLFGKTRPRPILTFRTAPPLKTNVTNFKNCFFIILGITAFFSPFSTKGWIVMLIMLTLAALLYLMTRRDAHAYTLVSILPVAAAGLLAAFLKLPSDIFPFIPLLIVSLWLVARGAWLLAGFLHTHPRHEEFKGVRV
jgi:hypothetical protein